MKKICFDLNPYGKFWEEIVVLKNNDRLLKIKTLSRGSLEKEGFEEINGYEFVGSHREHIYNKLVLQRKTEETEIISGRNEYTKYRILLRKEIWYEGTERKEIVSKIRGGFYNVLSLTWEDVMSLPEVILSVEKDRRDDYFDGQIFMQSANFIVHFESGKKAEIFDLSQEGQKYLIK